MADVSFLLDSLTGCIADGNTSPQLPPTASEAAARVSPALDSSPLAQALRDDTSPLYYALAVVRAQMPREDVLAALRSRLKAVFSLSLRQLLQHDALYDAAEGAHDVREETAYVRALTIVLEGVGIAARKRAGSVKPEIARDEAQRSIAEALVGRGGVVGGTVIALVDAAITHALLWQPGTASTAPSALDATADWCIMLLDAVADDAHLWTALLRDMLARVHLDSVPAGDTALDRAHVCSSLQAVASLASRAEARAVITAFSVMFACAAEEEANAVLHGLRCMSMLPPDALTYACTHGVSHIPQLSAAAVCTRHRKVAAELVTRAAARAPSEQHVGNALYRLCTHAWASACDQLQARVESAASIGNRSHSGSSACSSSSDVTLGSPWERVTMACQQLSMIDVDTRIDLHLSVPAFMVPVLRPWVRGEESRIEVDDLHVLTARCVWFAHTGKGVGRVLTRQSAYPRPPLWADKEADLAPVLDELWNDMHLVALQYAPDTSSARWDKEVKWSTNLLPYLELPESIRKHLQSIAPRDAPSAPVASAAAMPTRRVGGGWCSVTVARDLQLLLLTREAGVGSAKAELGDIVTLMAAMTSAACNELGGANCMPGPLAMTSRSDDVHANVAVTRPPSSRKRSRTAHDDEAEGVDDLQPMAATPIPAPRAAGDVSTAPRSRSRKGPRLQINEGSEVEDVLPSVGVARTSIAGDATPGTVHATTAVRSHTSRKQGKPVAASVAMDEDAPATPGSVTETIPATATPAQRTRSALTTVANAVVASEASTPAATTSTASGSIAHSRARRTPAQASSR